jgi:L-ascorbate metabolism protein UlaG (beta-lactamase superfamily)
MFTHKETAIRWLGHDSFLIRSQGKRIYIDPYQLPDTALPEADIIITTHEHFDHCNPEAINRIVAASSVLIGPRICQPILAGSEINAKKQVLTLDPGSEVVVDDMRITAIPAYNTHRFRAPGEPFHPKSSGHIGPILHFGDTTIYHAGDTDKIPEMDGLQPTIALLPVSGTYVMDVAEAVEAARAVDAQITIPMHVGRGIGELSDAQDFKNALSDRRVVVLDMDEGESV